jgi:hypothetical protein
MKKIALLLIIFSNVLFASQDVNFTDMVEDFNDCYIAEDLIFISSSKGKLHILDTNYTLLKSINYSKYGKSKIQSIDNSLFVIVDNSIFSISNTNVAEEIVKLSANEIILDLYRIDDFYYTVSNLSIKKFNKMFNLIDSIDCKSLNIVKSYQIEKYLILINDKGCFFNSSNLTDTLMRINFVSNLKTSSIFKTNEKIYLIDSLKPLTKFSIISHTLISNKLLLSNKEYELKFDNLSDNLSRRIELFVDKNESIYLGNSIIYFYNYIKTVFPIITKINLSDINTINSAPRELDSLNLFAALNSFKSFKNKIIMVGISNSVFEYYTSTNKLKCISNFYNESGKNSFAKFINDTTFVAFNVKQLSINISKNGGVLWQPVKNMFNDTIVNNHSISHKFTTDSTVSFLLHNFGNSVDYNYLCTHNFRSNISNVLKFNGSQLRNAYINTFKHNNSLYIVNDRSLYNRVTSLNFRIDDNKSVYEKMYSDIAINAIYNNSNKLVAFANILRGRYYDQNILKWKFNYNRFAFLQIDSNFNVLDTMSVIDGYDNPLLIKQIYKNNNTYALTVEEFGDSSIVNDTSKFSYYVFKITRFDSNYKPTMLYTDTSYTRIYHRDFEIDVNENIYLLKEDKTIYLITKDTNKTFYEANKDYQLLYLTLIDSSLYINGYYGIHFLSSLLKLNLTGKITSIENKTEELYFYVYKPYPNPTSNEINLKLYWDLSKPITKEDISIVNLSGLTVGLQGSDININYLDRNLGIININVANLPTGIYFVKFNYSVGQAVPFVKF